MFKSDADGWHQESEFEVFKSLIETYEIDPFEKDCSEIWWDLKKWRNEVTLLQISDTSNYFLVRKLKII